MVDFYERCLRFALERPQWIALFSAVLIVASFFCYKALGTDLLPEMDEGGFVLDYLTPAGHLACRKPTAWSATSSRCCDEVPEVESSSRRTGLELGLAAVTEANRGDIAVKLKSKRSRNVEEIIAELRATIRQQEPAVDVEFVQVLQDMIGDLSNAPEPVQIKLFSPDAALLARSGRRTSAMPFAKVTGVVDSATASRTPSAARRRCFR